MTHPFVGPDEVNRLGNQVIGGMLKRCHCDTPEDAANVLMSMVFLSTLSLCAVAVKEAALAQLTEMVDQLSKRPADSFHHEMMQ